MNAADILIIHLQERYDTALRSFAIAYHEGSVLQPVTEAVKNEAWEALQAAKYILWELK